MGRLNADHPRRLLCSHHRQVEGTPCRKAHHSAQPVGHFHLPGLVGLRIPPQHHRPVALQGHAMDVARSDLHHFR